MTPAVSGSQLTALKNDIAANVNTVLINGQSTQIKLVPVSPDNAQSVADWYNLSHATWTVWRDLPMDKVLSLVTFASMTPLDAIPTTPALTVQVWQARNDLCQTKQMSLQNLIISRTTAPMKQTSYRAGLQDCLTNIPAGASGALIAANWTGVRDAAKFLATNAEKLLSTGTGSNATPADLSAEGLLTGNEVMAAWAS